MLPSPQSKITSEIGAPSAMVSEADRVVVWPGQSRNSEALLFPGETTSIWVMGLPHPPPVAFPEYKVSTSSAERRPVQMPMLSQPFGNMIWDLGRHKQPRCAQKEGKNVDA